jgi:hypothetical protein
VNSFFKYEIKDGEVTITGVIKHQQTLEIPEMIDNFPVVCLGHNAFKKSQVVSVVNKAPSLTIDAECFKQSSIKSWVNKKAGSIKRVNKKAFYDCKKLVCFNFNSKETIIEDDAFRYSRKLSIVNLPEKITECGVATFRNTSYYNSPDEDWAISPEGFILNYRSVQGKTLTVPDTVSYIRENDISRTINLYELRVDCKQLKEKSLAYTKIEKLVLTGTNPVPASCCKGCSALRKVTFSSEIKRIKKDAFNGCYKLQEIELPESLRVLESYSFKDCILLQHIQFGNKLITIEKYAFENCNSLVKVNVPGSLRNISYYAFYNCISLRKLESLCKDRVTRDVQIMKGCPSLKEVRLSRKCA